MSGVNTFDGGSASFRPTGTALTAGSTLIAEWSDGKVLVAEGANPQRVDLGVYPPSSPCYSTGWIPTTDGDLLMANALAYVAGGASEPGSVYCCAEVSGTNPCPCGNESNTSNGYEITWDA